MTTDFTLKHRMAEDCLPFRNICGFYFQGSSAMFNCAQPEESRITLSRTDTSNCQRKELEH